MINNGDQSIFDCALLDYETKPQHLPPRQTVGKAKQNLPDSIADIGFPTEDKDGSKTENK